MIRKATLEDAKTLWELANQHELRVDPDFEAYPLSEIEEQITGYSEPGHPFLLDKNGVVACVFIHPDTPRGRIEIDLFTIGSKDQTSALFGFALDWAKEFYPEFELRSACNKLDKDLLEIFENSGLSFTRDYYKLQLNQLSTQYPTLPPGVDIVSVDLEASGELLHHLESESFSNHFGYVKVSAEDWIRERLALTTNDPKGTFVVYVGQEAAGFLISSDFRADVNGGWVDKLGVLEKYRGQGLGKLLLQWGAAHAANKGFTSLALGADTGNDSGALELYFKMGFEVQLSWRMYSRKK